MFLFLTIEFQFDICDQRHSQVHPCRFETQLCIYSLSKQTYGFSLYCLIRGKEKGRIQTLRGAECNRRKLNLRQALGELQDGTHIASP